VDYYVERMANTGISNRDISINGGRPYVKFRINYEDVEQGADHDMDMIVAYTIEEKPDGQIQITLDSDYAAGGYIQHAGYVISGTTKDGMYLEVRDADTRENFNGENYKPYRFNTPPGREPGYCLQITKKNQKECKVLPLKAKRLFTSSLTGKSANFLKDPLWYAAKYGMPRRDPKTVVGDPDNYFLVTNATTLKSQLTKAFNDIAEKNQSITVAAVDILPGSQRGNAMVYRSEFTVDQGWSADVLKEAWSEQEGALGRTRIWSAAEQLAGKGQQRSIWFASREVDGQPMLRPFTWSTLAQSGSNTNAAVSDITAWREALNRDPENGQVDGKVKERIAFLRGENDTLRQRPLLANGQSNLLGDIVNSSLLHVHGAAYETSAANALEGNKHYTTFAAAQVQQPEMLYVGANDGMLHAFQADSGREIFAFIPSAVREHLNILTHPDYGKAGESAPHRYFVDGTPVATDVYFNNTWHKVLIGSLGAGGRQIFALDVSNPTQPKLLWEFGQEQHAFMGYSLPQPTIVRLKDSNQTKGRWAVLLPGGYQGGSMPHEASLFVLNIADGSIIRHFSQMGAAVTENKKTLPDGYLPLGNGLSNIKDINNDEGMLETAYAGDLLGNLWRFDFSSPDPDQWKMQKLFIAQDANKRRQPITAAPYVTPHPLGQTHGDIVVFGTGRLLSAKDKNHQEQQSLYGIWDTGRTVEPLPSLGKTRNQLQRQQFAEIASMPGAFSLSRQSIRWFNEQGHNATWGWYVDFPRVSEKLVYDMQPYGRALLLTAVRFEDDPCAPGLNGTLYAINPDNGGGTDYSVFDVNGDGLFNASDMLDGRICSGGCDGGKTISPPNPRGGDNYGGENGRTAINHGVEYGRQTWNEQPANP